MKLNKIKNQVNKIKNENIKKDVETIKGAEKFTTRNGWTEATKEGASAWLHIELTKAQEKKAQTLAQYKKMLIEQVRKAEEKKAAQALARVEKAESVEQFPKEIKIAINWAASRTWGSNPTAELWAGAFGGYHKGRSVGGCGYDKRSTAAAEVLADCEAIKAAALYMLNKQDSETIKKALNGADLRGVFGYGLHFWGASVSFGGGCGMSAILEELQKIGYKKIFEHEPNAGGDVYYLEINKSGALARYNRTQSKKGA